MVEFRAPTDEPAAIDPTEPVCQTRWLARSVGPSEIASSAAPSVADTADDDAKSSSFQSESYVHASQIANGEGESTTDVVFPVRSEAVRFTAPERNSATTS